MILDGRTLVLVADGRRARLFEEARRGGVLHEHPDWLAGLTTPHVSSRGSKGGTHDRMGHAPHATAGEPVRDKAEAAFIHEVVRRVETVFHGKNFDHLAIIAAPRALGLLRRGLSVGVKARLALSEPHDRLDADEAELREVLRDLRRATA